MKKFTSLFALLSCLCVVSAQAEDVVTVYVDASNVSGAKYWYWGTTANPSDWSSRPSIPAPTVEIGDKHFSVLTFTPDDGNNVSVKFTNPNDDGQTDAISNLSAPNEYYYIYNGGNSYSAYVKSLGITTSDDWSVVNNFESSGNNTWIYTLDLTGNNNDISFQLRPNNCLWAGWNDNTAQSDWLYYNENNYGFSNSSAKYSKYKITAKWNGGNNATKNWSVNVEGITTFAVAGTSNSDAPNASGNDDRFFIKSWDPTIAINEMTLNGSTYELTRTVSNMAGTYYFKVVKNQKWNAGSYPTDNYQFTITSSDLVKVTFTYNTTNNEVNCVVDENCSELVIEDGVPFSATTEYTGVTSASYSRTCTNQWGSLCLPFEFSTDQDDVTFYEMKNVITGENGAITFSPIEGVIPAGQPVAFKLTSAGGDLTINNSDVNGVSVVTEAETFGPINDWYMKGTFTNTSASNIYIIQSNGIRYASSEFNLKPYRAWFTGNGNGAPLRISVDDTEGLQYVEQEDGTVKAYFDLQGRKLDGARKGLVIENGKIIMVK
jgi:hypothetical protein